MSQSKKYIIEVATNKASLQKLKNDLLEATQLPKDSVEVPALSRESKAQVKKDIATLFGVAEHQAESLQKMMQAVADGFADGKSVEAMKSELKDTLEFTNTIMKNMQKMGEATSWMDRGVTFVDDFIKMRDSLGSIKEVEGSIRSLEKTFGKFKNALAETNADAFLQRFGTSTKNDAQEFAAAQKTLQKLAKNRYKAVSEAIASGKSEELDYTGYSKEELEAEYADSIRIIKEGNQKIAQLKKEYKGKTQQLYKDQNYLDAISDMSMAMHQLENMHGLGDGIGSDLRASMQIATESVKEAGNEIQNLVKKLQGKGLELSVTLPDASSTEFASKISEFVNSASSQFKKKPIQLAVDLLDPFKRNASNTLSPYQQKLADQAKETAISSGTTSSENLIGLDTPDTSRIVRNILDSFQKVQQAVKEGQKNLTDETKKWRQEVNKELTLKAKFDNLDIKSEAAKLMKDVQSFLDSNPPLYLDVDTDALIEEIQEALKENVFSVNVKAGSIDGKGAVVNLGGAHLSSGARIEPERNDPQVTRPPQSEIPTINATKDNSEAVNESTRVQTVLQGAIKQLQGSIDKNTARNEIAEKNVQQNTEAANKNADKIAEYSQRVTEIRDNADNIADARRTAADKLPVLEQEREDALKKHAGRLRSFNEAIKNNDNEYIQQEFDWAVQYLNERKQETMNSIEEVHSRVDDGSKSKTLQYYQRVSDDIDSLLNTQDNQEDFILAVLQRAYQTERSKIEQDISGWQRTIDLQGKQIVGSNENIDYYNREIERLSKEVEISKSKRGIKSREAQSKNQQQRIDNLKSVLDSNESPVQLVFDEVQRFWKQSYKTIEKTKSELDDLKNSKYSDDLKSKLSKLSEDEQKAMVQGLITSKEKRINDWETRQTLMSQMGLGTNLVKDKDGRFVRTSLEAALKSFTVESLTDVLSKSSTLSDDLLSNNNLKSLSAIKEIAFYAGIAQDALGFRAQTSQEYVDEAVLQAKLMELARIKAFTDSVNGMFPRNNGTPELEGIEGFIEFFEKLNVTKDTISQIVAQAQNKIGAIQEGLIGVPEGSTQYQNKQLDINRLQSIIDSPISALDAAKEYLESYKNFANTIADDTRFAPGEDGKALSTSQIAQIIWDGMDSAVRSSVAKAMLSSSEFDGVSELNQISIAGVLDKMAKVFDTGALKDITSEDKSYQQFIALLNRQSNFQRARTITDLQYSGSVKSSLHESLSPDKPIYVKVVGSHGEENVYDLHRPGRGKADSDKSFSSNSKGLERFFKHLGITDQMEEIVSAMFNDPALAQNLMGQLFTGKNIGLSTKPFTRTASKDYSFADTTLAKNLEQKNKLEQEIANLESGKYSQLILKSLDGLSGEARTSKIQQIIANKKAELNQLTQLEFSEEEVNQALTSLADDIAIDKAKLKDAKRSKRRSSNRAANLIDEESPDWAYHTRQNTERSAAKNASDMIKSGTRGTSQNLANPLQQIIDRIRVAKEYNLMDTLEIEKLLSQYEEAYEAARNMPRIKDATTPISMFDEINAAWTKEEELRNQIFDTFFKSEGWYKAQFVQDAVSTVLGDLEREKQNIIQSTGTSNKSITSKLENADAEKQRLEIAADEYEASLQEKYIRNPLRDVAIALEQNERAIADKAKEIQTKKDNLYNIADNDEFLKIEYKALSELQEAELTPLREEMRNVDHISHPDDFKRISSQMDEVKSKYSERYRQIRQKWIDNESKLLDEEYKTFVDGINSSATNLAETVAIESFNEDMKDRGIVANSMEDIKIAIKNIVDEMYRSAAEQAEQTKASVDTSGVISTEEINAMLATVENKAKERILQIVKSVVGETDADLMSKESYGKTAEAAEAEVERLKQKIAANEKLLQALTKRFGMTGDIVDAENGVLQSYATQGQLDGTRSMGTSSGQGVGFFGAVDISNLATESTLRGLYQLLNGGPPKGGWGDAMASGVKEELDLVVHSFSGVLSNLASSVGRAVKDIGNQPYENMAFFNEDKQVGRYIKGEQNVIDAKRIKDFLGRHKSDNLKLALHNHPDGISALSPADIESAVALSSKYGVGASGAIADGKITGVDFSEISTELGISILEAYKKNIKESGFAGIFDDAFEIKPEFARGMLDENKQVLSQKLNEALRKAIDSVGLNSADIFAQVDISSLEVATQQVVADIIESGAQAAVEVSRSSTFTKDEVKAKQTALQEKFKTKHAETDRVEYSVKGASKIDQAMYNVGDRLTKEVLSDADLTKLTKAYSQLENAFKEEIINHLDQETIDFLNALRGQISSVLESNSSRLSAKDQQSKAIADAKKYLSELKTDDGEKVTGASRVSTGIDQIYAIINNGTEKLSDADLTSVAQGYYRLQEMVNHAVFEKLDENTKKVINNAIQEAKVVLDEYNVSIQGKELIGTVLDKSNKDLFENAAKDRTRKAGKTIKSISEPQIMREDKIISKASVYIGKVSKKQAATEHEVAQELQQQAQLSAEVAQQKDKAAENAERHANAEQKVTEKNKKDKTQDKPKISSDDKATPTSTSSNTIKVPESGNNDGGILGLLGRIAQESTLQSILSQLSKGIKTDSSVAGGKRKNDAPWAPDIVKDDQDALNRLQEEIRTRYPDFASVGNSRAVSGGHAIDVFQYKNLDAIKEARANIAKLNAEGKAGTQEWNEETQKLNALLVEQEKITLKINNSTGEITAKSSFQNLAVGAKAASKELQIVDNIISQLHDAGTLSLGSDGSINSSNNTVQNYLNNLRSLEQYRSGLSSEQLFSPAVQQQLSTLTLALQTSRKEVMALIKASAQLNIGEKIDTDKLKDGIDGLSDGDIKQVMQDIISDNTKLEASFKALTPVTNEFGETVGYQLAYTLHTGKNSVQEMTAVLNPLTNELRVQKGSVKEVATGWQQFFSGLKGKAASIMQYLISITSIHDIFRYFSQGVQYVRDIDGALTELKKVTDETDASYAKFLQDMSQTGSAIGATVSDLTTMASEWARLGYSMQEAGELAKSTAILLNVSEFDDATQASEALISTMQAFQYTADESQHVVDVLNEVGFQMPRLYSNIRLSCGLKRGNSRDGQSRG